MVAAAAGAVLYVSRDRSTPAQTARPYLALWEKGRFELMRRLVANPPPDFEEIHRKAAADLMTAGMDLELARVTEEDDRATAQFVARLKLKGLGDWSYRGRLTLRPGEERWMVDWTPSAIHPDLGSGRSFSRTRSWPERASILAADGTALAAGGEGVVVGIQPNRVRDPEQVKSVLQSSLGSDPARVSQLLDRGRARPDQFIAIAEISEDRYAAVRPAIYEIPGLVFQRKGLRVSPTDDLARQLVGRVGEVTKEGLAELGEPYIPGDRVGQFGLEAAMERELAGRPSGEVRVTGADGPAKVLHRFPGAPAAPVRTTLDVSVQRSADAALDGVEKPSALVVLDAATAQVKAVANRPLDGFNRAVAGKYAPGSTFKVVTTSALLASGVKPEQRVECPSQTSAGGRAFRNFEGEGLGTIDFRTAFRQSCNTAFVNLVRELEEERLMEAAETFGFGADYSLRVTTAGGSFPPPRDTTERAAAAIGQARVTASPLHMASVAAAAATGSWRPPSLITGEAGAETPPAPGPLGPAISPVLRELMRSVVEDGTGERARVPGREVAGKTGTAEFGTARPPRTHAWFIGFSGPLAFAVLVEDGGVGGEVAAPIAARFLSSLNRTGGTN